MRNIYENFQKSKYIKKLEEPKKLSPFVEKHKAMRMGKYRREYLLLTNYKKFDGKKIILGILDYHTGKELHEFLNECVYCGGTENLGLDRIDNNKGHTKENVLPCCRPCNTMRGDNFTVVEMKKIGKVIKMIKESR